MQRQGLYRSRKDRVFGGVAGGIARSLNADPAIVRLIFALMIIVGGGGILLYLILWIAIPEEPFQFYQENEAAGGANPVNEEASPGSPIPQVVYPPRRNNGTLIAGLILIAIGAIFLADRFLPNIRIHLHDFWPLIIVIAGIALIFSSLSGIKKS
ncbi:MAG: PspC domain-containing protein [Bacteroidales bacterium]|nr:PspC domain-containing protein [Bacteroidales bacterium]